jgi:hypothetical protein
MTVSLILAGGMLFLLLGGSLLAFCLMVDNRPSGADQEEAKVTDKRPIKPTSKTKKSDELPPKPLAPEPLSTIKTAPKKSDVPIAGIPQEKPASDTEAGEAKGISSAVVFLAANQQEIDAAIAKGVAYLKSGLDDTGRFGAGVKGTYPNSYGNIVGGSALIGLTLLSCGVPADDPQIAGLASRVRSESPTLMRTYDLCCCIWFLDKLGQKSDTPLIRQLALRLIAAQGSRGGWNYNCAPLSAEQETQLLQMLEDQPYVAATLAGSGQTPADSQTGKGKPQPKDKTAVQPPAGKQVALSRATYLPADLKDLPVLRFQGGKSLAGDKQLWWEDNSLTQFAMLALWAAKNHGVAADRSLAMAEARFRQSQNANGTWEYTWGKHGNVRSDSMTCAGLLGLAVGRGLDKAPAKRRQGNFGKDAQVEKALLFLGERIGRSDLQPSAEEVAKANEELTAVKKKLTSTKLAAGEWAALTQRQLELQYTVNRGKGGQGRTIHANAWGDFYFMWSVERVAVVYSLKTIGGKDWYAWGSEILLARQNGDGSWRDAFAGPIDTCFALLFLKRANVAQDLTKLLQGLGGVRDPGEMPVTPAPITSTSRSALLDEFNTSPGRVKTRQGYVAPPKTN